METVAILLTACFGLFLLIVFFGTVGSMIRMEFGKKDTTQKSPISQEKNADKAAF